MGWLRKRSRNRLMNHLLEEGKLTQYKNQINNFLEDLGKKELKLVNQVKKAYPKDEGLAKITIEQVREIVALKEKVQEIHAYIDTLETKKDNNLAYNNFLDYLNKFNKQDLQSKSKRKTKKVIKKSNNQIKDINQWTELIEKRISKIDKFSLDEANQKRHSKEKIDVKAFLESYE